jgi:hypothetical protein
MSMHVAQAGVSSGAERARVQAGARTEVEARLHAERMPLLAAGGAAGAAVTATPARVRTQ